MTLKPTHRAHLFVTFALLLAAVAGASFRRQWQDEPVWPSSGVTRQGMLSDYHPALKGTAGDTPVLYYDSGKPGGTVLICGGTHPNEPAAYLAAVLIAENLRVSEGRAIVIPRANRAGFMHNDPQEAMLQRYRVPTPHGERVFRNGSRFTAPARQWPDPTIYINPRGSYWDEIIKGCPDCAIGNRGPGGQTLAGVDSRNLNRVYPGRPNGTLTEQIAHAIITLIRQENVSIAIDFHEASPEYPTINVIVAHPRAGTIAGEAELDLSMEDVIISIDISSPNLRGLSHREWGDASDVYSILLESANPAMGRLKGRMREELITKGHDETYLRAQRIQARLNERLAEEARRLEAEGRKPRERSRKILYVDIPEEGIPLEVRVGRHVAAARHLVAAFSREYPERAIAMEGLPEYADIQENRLGHYLAGPTGQRPAASGE